MERKGFLNRIGIVYVAINCVDVTNTVLGVYSSVESAIDSVQVYLEGRHPNTQWAWFGEHNCLENVDDDWHKVFIMPFQLDNDGWRRYNEQS